MKSLFVASMCACALAAPSSARQNGPAWSRTFDGPASYDDRGIDVLFDAAGNVVTVANVYVSPQSGLYVPQIATLKYSALGQLQWSQLYGTGYYGGNGNASRIALAPNGNVIVAGARDLGQDWVVLSYTPAGTLAWSTIWPAGSWWVSEPEDLEIDANGNVFLCGDFGDPGSFSSSLAALVKLDASGTIAWVKTYDGSGNSIETVSDMTLDPSGAIYLTGGQTVTNSALQFSVAKVDAQGNPVWIRNHGALSVSANDFGVRIERAASGAVVATGGIASNTTQGPGVTTISYDANGVQLWRVDYNSTPFIDEFANDLALDASGAAYVCGSVEVGGSDWDGLVLRIANGQLQWTRTISGTAFLDDSARALAVTANGSALVAGERTDSGSTEWFLQEYSPGGTLVHDLAWPGPFNDSSRFAALARAPNGDIAIAGDSYSGTAQGEDVVTASFAFGGTSTYCTAGTSALGCTGAISGTGTPSASAGSGFTIAIDGLDGQRAGLIFYGVSGSVAVAWGPTSSFLCVKTPTQRTPLQISGGTSGACDGVLSFDFNAYLAAHPDALGAPFTPGTVFDAQGWYRDPPSAKATALSNGLEFTLQP